MNKRYFFSIPQTPMYLFSPNAIHNTLHAIQLFLSKTNELKILTRPNVQRFVDDDPGRLVIGRYNFYLYCMWITLLVASTRFSHYSKIICQRVASIVHVIDVITLKYKRIHINLVLIIISGTG